MASCSITVGGVEIVDRPLVVQFAANDPAVLLEAALHAQALGADAVDINFGCPQRRASEGHYGAYLLDRPDWALCESMVRTLSEDARCRIPCFCKIRLIDWDDFEATIEFARALEARVRRLFLILLVTTRLNVR